jgi:hypothetical protein
MYRRGRFVTGKDAGGRRSHSCGDDEDAVQGRIWPARRHDDFRVGPLAPSDSSLFVNRCGGGAWACGVGPSTDGDGGRRVVDGSGNGLCRSSPTPALGTGPAGIGRAASRSATNCARSCSARSATHPHHRGQARARSRPVESPAWRSGHAAACAPGTRRSARSAPPHRTRRQATAPRPAGSRSSAGPRGPPGMPGARAARTPQIDDPRRPDNLERAQGPETPSPPLTCPTVGPAPRRNRRPMAPFRSR